MIGDPFVVSKLDSEDDHNRGLLEARKIRGGREATPPRSTEESATSGKIVLVEGNIGIGKTTLCRELSERLKYKPFFEPATENPYLEKFYSNPKKYALQLQLWIFNQRCHTYVDALKHIVKTGEGVILDRSVYSDCVFANVGRSEGYISEEGYALYQKLRNEVLQKLPPPSCIVYLSAPAEVCHKRIMVRGRDCESGIPLEYLASLQDEYKLFVDEMSQYSDGICSVLEFDWSNFGSTEKIAEGIQNTSSTMNNDKSQRMDHYKHTMFSSLQQAIDQCQECLV